MAPASHPHPRLAQSPWFWVHLFAVFCLAVLMLRGDKIVALRTQRARNAQMRAQVSGRTPASRSIDSTVLADSERQRLIAAYAFFGLVALGAWWQVWRTVLRPKLRDDIRAVRRASLSQSEMDP